MEIISGYDKVIILDVYDPLMAVNWKSNSKELLMNKVAIVCIIGSNMDKPGVLGKVANALGEN